MGADDARLGTLMTAARGAARKSAIAAAFGAAAAHYEAHAEVQRHAAEALAGGIAALGLPDAAKLLEIGCGTGLLSRALAASLPGARGLITDLSAPMVAACRGAMAPGRFVYAAMDGEAPAVGGAGLDLICASLAWQWFEDPAAAVHRLRPLLRAGGWLALATLGPASLGEWRLAHEAEGLAAGAPVFADPAAMVAGWRGEARLEHSHLRIAHASGRAFLDGLRGIGATTPRAGHRPLAPAALGRVLARFEHDHAARVSYEIVLVYLRAA
jgi:malonyl-CoA O-methyltransferase